MCVLLLAGAVSPDAGDVPAEGPDDGMPVLRRAAEAADEVAYSAVREVTGEDGESDLLVRVVNRPGDGIALLPLEGAEDALVVRDSSLQALDDSLLSTLEDVYAVRDAGRDELGGRNAHLVEALRADGTAAGRFWVDAGTGVLLGSSVYGERGERVLGFRTTGLEMGDEHWPDHASGDEPWGDVLTGGEREELREQGWVLPERLAWNLCLVDARSTSYGDQRVIHAVYSDGLSQVSVFIQRGRLDTGSPAVLRNGYLGTGTGGSGVTPQHDTIPGGDTGRYHSVWQADGFVFTVLADAPAGLASSAVTALPGPEDSGFWSRVRRGMARLGFL
nr:sigma-E factor regulatory protein RseB domain-containing protein [Nocardiopsis algeriensis]